MTTTQRLREAAAHDLALQRAAEDRRWLGERPDPDHLDDDAIAAEIHDGERRADAAFAEASARRVSDPARAAQIMLDAGRAEAAWARRYRALLAEQRRRERAALDAATNPRVRGRALSLRQVWLTNGGDRTRSDTPPRYLPWDQLPTHEARAWAALAIDAGDRVR